MRPPDWDRGADGRRAAPGAVRRADLRPAARLARVRGRRVPEAGPGSGRVRDPVRRHRGRVGVPGRRRRAHSSRRCPSSPCPAGTPSPSVGRRRRRQGGPLRLAGAEGTFRVQQLIGSDGLTALGDDALGPGPGRGRRVRVRPHPALGEGRARGIGAGDDLRRRHLRRALAVPRRPDRSGQARAARGRGRVHRARDRVARSV